MEPLFYAFFFLLVLLVSVLFMIKRDTTLQKVVIERPPLAAGYLFENQFEMITPSFVRKLGKPNFQPLVKKRFDKVKQWDASGNQL
jgi:hypothetical protein